MTTPKLNELIAAATSLDVGKIGWLLEASVLSGAICDAVLGDPHELATVQRAVRAAAAVAGCDLIVGASPAADRVVRDLIVHEEEPSKALLFELVRVTGSTFAQAREDLRHIDDVVQAVFVDVNPSSRPGCVLAVGAIES